MCFSRLVNFLIRFIYFICDIYSLSSALCYWLTHANQLYLIIISCWLPVSLRSPSIDVYVLLIFVWISLFVLVIGIFRFQHYVLLPILVAVMPFICFLWCFGVIFEIVLCFAFPFKSSIYYDRFEVGTFCFWKSNTKHILKLYTSKL